jgi:hypothetical protein
MKITSKKIRALDPCNDGWKWYSKNASHITDLKKLLRVVDAKNSDWCRWLFTRLMTKKQRIEIAVFSAKQVLDVYERRYPNDKRPRDAINAAKAVLKNDTEENRSAAYAAAYAAYYAADAVDAARTAAHAADAAYAAAYAANAARAVNSASAAANAAAAYAANAAKNKKKIREKIYLKAVSILNKRK